MTILQSGTRIRYLPRAGRWDCPATPFNRALPCGTSTAGYFSKNVGSLSRRRTLPSAPRV